MTLLDRVLDSSLIPRDRHSISTQTTNSTDTAPDAAHFSGVADLMIESQGESPQLQGMLLHLRLQESPSSVAPTISQPAPAANSAIPPAGVEHLPNSVILTTPSLEAPFKSTEWVVPVTKPHGCCVNGGGICNIKPPVYRV